MWSSVLSCCNPCLLWAQPSVLRKPLVSQKDTRKRLHSTARRSRSSVSWMDECHPEDEEDEEEEEVQSRSTFKSSRRSTATNEDPFKNISRNKLRKLSVKSRRDSSSDTDTSSVLTTSKSSIVSQDVADGNFPRVQKTKKPTQDKKFVPGGCTPPPARTVTVTQQPRREEIFRPDLVDSKPKTKATSGSQLRGSEKSKLRDQRLQSISSSLNSSRSSRKTPTAPFISPQEAACVAVDNRPASSASSQGADRSSFSKWLSGTENQKKSLTNDEGQRVEGVGNRTAAYGNYQYQATSAAGARTKVNLRSKSTVQSIGAKKASLQAQTITQYTFGFIYIAYKFSKERKLEVDVLKVTKLPKYEAVLFADEHNDETKAPSLKYVDIEVCLRLTKGKELTHKIKKFRTGDDNTDDMPFEPECCFRHKNMEDCTLVLTVNRRRKNQVVPTQSVGHALLKLSRQDVRTSDIVNKTLPLKHGIQRQDVKGSVLLVLTCKHSVARMVELCLEVRLVQYVDVTLLGITPNMPDFKVKPEIKIKTQLIGSEKSGSTRAREFPWIGLQNNTSLARRQEEGAGDFGGWGTLFSEGCSTSRTVLDSELKALTLSFVVQVYGRNNVGPAAKKEVLLGTVVLGPELKCSPDFPSSVEDGTLTQWGEAVIKRTAVMQLHRLHL
ncbi:hypothetical protein FHG87_015919 [Trinorchestia longiramus]|nr:hypothetical protein FHG87_015919 [Trinorchestia longiramus]